MPFCSYMLILFKLFLVSENSNKDWYVFDQIIKKANRAWIQDLYQVFCVCTMTSSLVFLWDSWECEPVGPWILFLFLGSPSSVCLSCPTIWWFLFYFILLCFILLFPLRNMLFLTREGVERKWEEYILHYMRKVLIFNKRKNMSRLGGGEQEIWAIYSCALKAHHYYIFSYR